MRNGRSFLGKIRALVPAPMDRNKVVPVPKVSGTGTHSQNRVGTGTDQSGTGTDASSSPDLWYACIVKPQIRTLIV